ncbi:MAG TPA: sulfite exporter TauE/SafE family protein [Candidatus Eisenbacteria bacterium]|nr:sulfite exporter TauE/SafE family protein [Candidatus Eisenbacteria bacterium]
MTVFEVTLLIALGSFAAGLLGALTGLGGGIVIVPMLTLVFHVHLRYAAGAALVSVIATSSGAGAAYVREGFTNIRLAMFLEIATVLGALAGAYAAAFVPPRALAIAFAAVLLHAAYRSLRPHPDRATLAAPHPWAARLRLNGAEPLPDGDNRAYTAQSVPLGFAIMSVAGAISGLLGIGSGALKVLALDQAMRLPYKVSAATSNFMIGVTAAASAGIYIRRGYVDPGLAFPVMIGVLLGALVGARLLAAAPTRHLRTLFTVVIVVLAIEMLARAVRGEF